MQSLLKKAGLGVALAATSLTVVAAPAQAQRYHRGYHGYHRGGDVAGAAILGGIVGLGVGAAIASDHRDRYYDNGYYDRGYAQPGYYDNGYYAYRGPRCYVERRYDPYYRHSVRVRVCR